MKATYPEKLMRGTLLTKKLLKKIEIEYRHYKKMKALSADTMPTETSASEVKPCLGIIQIGRHLDATLFIKHKIRKCDKLGFMTKHLQLDEMASTSKIIRGRY